MIKEINSIFQLEDVIPHFHASVLVGTVTTEEQGIALTSSILYSLVDARTTLYLSGGRTPKKLYELLAREEKLLPAAVGMIDERYGEKFHGNSNELMIQATGLLRYLQMRDIPFAPILQGKTSRVETAESYDGVVRGMHATFSKSVGILGIGVDSHTAGIPAQNGKLKLRNSKFNSGNELVTHYNDESGQYGERVTMTFLGLSMLDVLLVLVFGKDKRQALEMAFSDGSEEDVPSRFYTRPEIAEKTIIITDQEF